MRTIENSTVIYNELYCRTDYSERNSVSVDLPGQAPEKVIRQIGMRLTL